MWEGKIMKLVVKNEGELLDYLYNNLDMQSMNVLPVKDYRYYNR